ncbi:hypothetical protein V5T82_11485 [Magnetovibrio sp. PR-2]|uniref:hypothetical protein n=1 Tax=Magnetovibrio sp. PR-2 TaxID=3120356 RepID=UPI002FCDFCF8
MHVTNTIDCNGLSPATTILRIKQALIARPEDDLPLNVLIDSNCDCDDLADSLGDLAEDVTLTAGSDAFHEQD